MILWDGRRTWEAPDSWIFIQKILVFLNTGEHETYSYTELFQWSKMMCSAPWRARNRCCTLSTVIIHTAHTMTAWINAQSWYRDVVLFSSIQVYFILNSYFQKVNNFKTFRPLYAYCADLWFLKRLLVLWLFYIKKITICCILAVYDCIQI